MKNEIFQYRPATHIGLFFSVSTAKLEVMLGGEKVFPPNYKVLHNKANFLGIKPQEKNKQDVFYVTHQFAYECGRILAKAISIDLRTYSD